VIIRNIINKEFLKELKSKLFDGEEIGDLMIEGVRSQFHSPTFTLFHSSQNEKEEGHKTMGKLNFDTPSYSHSLSSSFSLQDRKLRELLRINEKERIDQPSSSRCEKEYLYWTATLSHLSSILPSTISSLLSHEMVDWMKVRDGEMVDERNEVR